MPDSRGIRSGWSTLTHLGVLKRVIVTDTAGMRQQLTRLGDACARSRVVRDERGIALIMAMGIMLILTVALTTVIFLTASGARDASRTNSGEKAYAIAEAGLNNALAQLAPHYPTFTPAGLSSWVSPTTQAYPGGGACSGTTDCVAWTGTFSGSDWTLTGTGTVFNPSGGTSIARTVSAKLHVTQVPDNFQPYGIFAGDPQAQCTDIGGNISVDVPVYIKNCLNLHGTFSGSYLGYTADARIWDAPPYTTVAGVSTSAHTVTINVVHNLDPQRLERDDRAPRRLQRPPRQEGRASAHALVPAPVPAARFTLSRTQTIPDNSVVATDPRRKQHLFFSQLGWRHLHRDQPVRRLALHA